MPSWASVGGKAAHLLIQVWDENGCPEWDEGGWKDHADTAFHDCIVDEVARSGVDPALWRISGAATKAWPDKETRDWWSYHLPEFGAKYAAWREANAHLEIWQPDGASPAIELDACAQLGGAEVKAYIDRVFIDRSRGDQLVVWDAKFGRMPPENATQLAIYAALVEILFGVRAAFGLFYRGRTGEDWKIFKDKPALMPLNHLPTQVIARQIQAADTLMSAGVYPAKPGKQCDWCDVRNACFFNQGRDAVKYDPEHPLYGKEAA